MQDRRAPSRGFAQTTNSAAAHIQLLPKRNPAEGGRRSF